MEILYSTLKKTQYPNAVYNLLGDNYLSLNKTYEAVKCYKNSIKWYKFFVPPNISLAKIYINKGDFKKAEYYLNKILKVKKNPEAREILNSIKPNTP